MAALNNAAIAAVQLEKVLPLVDGMYEYEDALLSRFKKVKSEDQSSRDMRLPMQIRPGGDFGQTNFDGGDWGRGSAPSYAVATVSPLDFKLGVEYTSKVKMVTDNKEKAIANIMNRLVADAMMEFKAQKDKQLNTAGDCIIGYITVVNSTLLTLGTPFYAQLCRHNQIVQVYDYLGTTNRGSARITQVDLVNNQITLASLPAGTTAGNGTTTNDRIVIDGVSGSNPVGTYGLPYHHNDAATGSWLTISRVTYPEVRTPSVNANGPLTPVHAQVLQTKMEMIRGSNTWQGGRWFWYMHPQVQTEWVLLMQQISEITLGNNGQNGKVDLLFDRKQQRSISGFEVLPSINADRTRIDLIDGNNWVRGTYLDTTLLPMAGSQRLPVYGASGGFGGAELFYIGNAEQYAVRDPRKGGYIKGLTLTASYA